MRNRFQRLNSILHFIGDLLTILGLILLVPVIAVCLYWGRNGDGWRTLTAFLIASLVSFSGALFLKAIFKSEMLDTTGAMLMCAVGWIVASALGAVPFVIGIGSGYLNGYFEAMSGFTTTGITVYSGLDAMPRSILIWRSLMEWLGGIGILSFFLLVVSAGSSAPQMFGAESHKISSGRPAPGLSHTLKILWLIYAGFTLLAAGVYTAEGMPVFDSLCHALTTLSTGGFSPHDASMGYYRLTGQANYKLIEYTVTFFMMLGGINFLVHYRVLTGDVRALWDNIEIRYWWRLIVLFVIIIMLDHLRKAGLLGEVFSRQGLSAAKLEQAFRYSIFQVVSVLTTTGFVTKDIGSDFFPTASKQLFLVMMVIGGCVGSTAGGFKVLRVAILNRLMLTELFKTTVSERASTGPVIDNKIVPDSEIHRVGAWFFTWVGLLVAGGVVTAIFSPYGIAESFSGMFSALGNIGPCYISVEKMINIHPVVKLTYIFGMLAGRLEILPVLLLFSPKAWR